MKTRNVTERKAAIKDALRKINQVKRILSEQSNSMDSDHIDSVHCTS